MVVGRENDVYSFTPLLFVTYIKDMEDNHTLKVIFLRTSGVAAPARLRGVT